MGRFINADDLVSTGQSLLGNNMLAYCCNNPVVFTDSSGFACVPCSIDGGGYAPNTDFLMAFYGVDSPSEIPEMPEGAMIFVENISSVSLGKGFCIAEGKTIVMDANKYCEYTFVGIGWSASKSIPLDRTFTQGYVYGVEKAEDYCGLFVGGSSNMLSTVSGGAYASPKVYAEITGGMSYAPSVGESIHGT